MLGKIELLSILVSVGLLIFVLFLVRTKRLRLKYSLLWLLTFVIMLLLSCFPSILNKISLLMSIYYPPSLLFLVAFLFLLLIVLHYSMEISNLFESTKGLIQKFSIMNYKLEELEKKVNQLDKK